MSAEAPPADKSNPKWLSFVGLLAIAAGVGLAWYSYHIRQLATASQSWPKAAGKVLKSYVAQQRQRKQQNNIVETEYQAKVEYEYHVNGVRYDSSRIRFAGPGSTDVESKAQQIVALYPVDAAVDVYYDPLNPGMAVLDRTFSPFGTGLVIGLGICTIIFGAALIIWAQVAS